jgi:putative copper export protein
MSTVDIVVIAVRALSFVAALQAAGVPLFLWLFGDDLRNSAAPIAAAAGRTALIALLATAAYQIFEPMRLAGTVSGVVDGSLQAALLASSVGAATAVRLFGLALVAIGALKPSRTGAAVALIGSALIAGSFAFTGHTATSDQRWLLAPLLLLHLLIVAFWFGSLWPLLLVGRHEDLTANARIIERFSKLAVLVVPLIFVAGLGVAFVLLPNLAAVSTSYGQLLLAKVAGFALLMGLAALNKWHLGPRIGAGSVAALGSLRRCVVVEWWLIAGVLIATAAMTGLFSPDH